MSSPFYPYPSPQSLPSPLSNLLPSIAQQTSGLALTPNTNPFLGLAPPSQSFPPSALGQGGTSGSVNSVRSSVRRDEVTLEDTLRALEEGGVLVDRARGVLEEIGRVQASVFEPGGVGENGRLELLQLEYDQIINTLYTLSISSSFGALPLLPASSTSSDPTSSNIPLPDTNSSTSDPNLPAVDGQRGTPTMDTPELISWCESRAGLEFSRREGVKNGSKVILDILKAR